MHFVDTRLPQSIINHNVKTERKDLNFPILKKYFISFATLAVPLANFPPNVYGTVRRTQVATTKIA